MMAVETFDPWTMPRYGWVSVNASAGTGKTWNIVAIVLRLIVLEQVPADAILTVTFTRAATQELRQRIRAGLESTRAALEAWISDAESGDVVPGASDSLYAGALWKQGVAASGASTVSTPTVVEWTHRLTAALQNIDQMPIETIHGFAARSLRDFSLATGAAFHEEMVTDISAETRRAVADVLARIHVWAPDLTLRRLLFEEDLSALSKAVSLAWKHQDEWDVSPVSTGRIEQVMAVARAVAPDCATWVDAWVSARDGVLQPLFSSSASSMTEQASKCPRAWLPESALRDALRNDARASLQDIGHMVRALEGEKSSAIVTKTKQGKWRSLTSEATQRALDALSADAQRYSGLRAEFHTWFLQAAVEALRTDLRTQGKLEPDDAIRRLAAALSSLQSTAVVDALRTRYQVALIDECQDTDARQWRIFQAIFPPGHSGRLLVMIGDPKQSIYAFRGADVRAYLDASQSEAVRRYTFRRNYRSSAEVLAGLEAWMAGEDAEEGFFGSESAIAFEPVQAGRDNVRRLVDHAGVEVRWVPARELSRRGQVQNRDFAERRMAEVVASDVVALLAQGQFQSVADGPGRPVEPGDIAILVSMNRQVDRVAASLQRRGIPVVSSTDRTLLETDEAIELEQLFASLQDPGDRSAGIAALTTRWLGFQWMEVGSVPTAVRRGRLADWQAESGGFVAPEGAPRDIRELAAQRIQLLHRRAEKEGVLRVLRDLVRDWQRSEEVRTLLGAERSLVNAMHLVELLTAWKTREHWSDAQLMREYALRRSTMGPDGLSPRLERDAHAVRVMTIHKSKGLEFPIVLLPTLALTKDSASRKSTPPLAERVQQDGRRTGQVRLWVETPEDGLAADAWERFNEALRAADAAEERRREYVALTRGASYVGVYLFPFTNRSRVGPVRATAGRVTAIRDALLSVEQGGATDPAVWDAAAVQAVSVAGPVRVRLVSIDAAARYTPPETSLPRLSLLAVPEGLPNLGNLWKQPSFSAWILSLRAADDASESGEPPVAVPADEPTDRRDDDERDAVGSDDASGETGVSPELMRIGVPEVVTVPVGAGLGGLLEFPAGAKAGTVLHEWFERADFAWARDGQWESKREEAVDLLLERVSAAGLRVLPRGASDLDVRLYLTRVAEDLRRVLTRPLVANGPDGRSTGPAIGRLCDVGRSDRLDELEFWLRLGSGTQTACTYDSIEFRGRVPEGRTWLGSLKRTGDVRVTEAWAQSMVARSEIPSVRGLLNGKIDLVFRRDGRWYVVDYKSNRLGWTPGEPLRPLEEAYGLEGMRASMEEKHYILQYHLYTVALYRWLKLRLGEAFDYERDFGGIWYLYLRGMAAPWQRVGDQWIQGQGAIDDRTGVFFDRPPLEVVAQLDAWFSTGATEVSV